MSALPPMRPLYLGSGERAFFAVLHPGGEPTQQRAVLLCAPFGWEDMCSYRSRLAWAEHLAREGYATLRIDLPGSGDSAGSPRDPGQLDAWTGAVSEAADWLRASTGVAGVTVVGIGLGGLVACRAALDGARIDELVLWAVPSRGRALVRELRAFSRMEVAHVLDGEAQDSEQPAAELPVGAVAANGYLLSSETVAELEALDLSELDPGPVLAKRALVLGRDGLKADERLHALLERAGMSVTLADGPGFGAMTVEPQEAVAPSEVFELLSAWLSSPAGGLAPAETSRAGATPDALPLPAQQRPRESDQLQLQVSGVELRETPVFIERPDGRLFGILTEPIGRREELCVVLMNAGPQRHIGPNRMWVEIARRWAARGVSTLRLDVAGIGDSDGDAAPLVRVAALYAPEYVEQARAALDALQERGLPERTLMLGLCSGAYWSMHAALQDSRISSVVMLNPRALIWDEFSYAVRRTQELRERVLLPSTWLKVLRGDITPARHLETARALAARAVLAPGRAARRARAGRSDTQAQATEPIAELFDALGERDQRTLMLLTGREPLTEELTRKGLLDQLEQWPALRLVRAGTSADTHTLTPIWLQQEVHELIDGVLELELERLAQASSVTQAS
jgi:alpha-beta hydrolase superfamily lysophospholipase